MIRVVRMNRNDRLCTERDLALSLNTSGTDSERTGSVHVAQFELKVGYESLLIQQQ